MKDIYLYCANSLHTVIKCKRYINNVALWYIYMYVHIYESYMTCTTHVPHLCVHHGNNKTKFNYKYILLICVVKKILIKVSLCTLVHTMILYCTTESY